MKVFDCAVLGAGPAGLNASLVLGRARRSIALFDNGTNRNRVTQESHGFVTRDGITPSEFKAIGIQQLSNYPSVQLMEQTVIQVTKQDSSGIFEIQTAEEQVYYAEKIILATGVQEEYLSVPEIKQYYGKTLFSCPYCDGWELRDKPLVILIENEEAVHHMAKLLYNWSKDLVVATNGESMSISLKDELESRNIRVVTEPVTKLHGEEGVLESIEFASGLMIPRSAGFIVPKFKRSSTLIEQLGCELDDKGAVLVDEQGRTTQKNVYTAGENRQGGPSSLIISAAEGSKAAIAVNIDLTNERF
ncbi:NAD(P)/FAD-dependent oxidoreductase [Paenibacillus sp. Marseille-Q4541]|uniref:NAD(P)/FAD-dependent oxidoreductase n=1 Tax=Paenibacillus sp. Marseille-Q4541 TaxID=2831522 RepID=UPI001BAB7A3F|nr:NAD(P)/FAD-dependent oxidoreductase [Paenibacillus sp. Marseille-Q4541]